jgi:arylsulfatase A-like enzyme
MRRLGLGLLGLVLAAAAAATGSGLGATSSSAATATGSAGARAAVDQRPNIVMIVVDDMRDDELQYMPRTRRLLGGRGVRFLNSFAPYPLCCPARASYFTGQYTHNHAVYSTEKPYAFPALKDGSTLATWLQDAGYATVMLGKYMNGYGFMPEPGKKNGNSRRYVPPGWTNWRASFEHGFRRNGRFFGGTYNYTNTTLSRDGQGYENYRGRYQTDVFGELSDRIIARRSPARKPFFLYASYAAPHHGGPREPDDPGIVRNVRGERQRFVDPARPDWVRGRYDRVIKAAPGAYWRDPDPSDKPEYLRPLLRLTRAEKKAMRESARQRAEALYVVDKAVGRTVRALKDSGELDDTLLIFTSDNGYFLGEQGIRQGKTLPYEPSLRTPLLMRGPGIPAGERRRDPFLSIDFAPTIADLAGATPGIPVDGVSMLPVARRGDKGWSRAVLTETGSRGVIRETDEAGQALTADDPGERDTRWAIGIRTPRYLYVSLATDEEELYDINRDPEQYVNLVADPGHAEVLERLRGELARMRACDGDQCRSAMSRRLQ